MLTYLKRRARQLKQEIYALYLAARDPRTPWLARMVAGLVVAYALSPIDLIPDFVPVLGYLDDLILVPLGIALALRLIPPSVLAESRAAAVALHARGKLHSRSGLLIVVTIWLVLIALFAAIMLR